MGSRSGIITLVTDFGLEDSYVGVVKGVILGVFPKAGLVDITHQVPAQDVYAAAWALKDAAPYFPRGTVHLAVVDPGVGSERKGIALSSGGWFFVGPDNGIFSAFLPAEEAVELNRPGLFLPEVSATFHARDVFAPVAARLAAGMELSDAGDEVSDLVSLGLPEPIRQGDLIRGEVVRVDRFGNLVTNIPASMIPQGTAPFIEVCEERIKGLSACYSFADPDAVIALVGSAGRVEVSVKNASAAQALNAGAGDEVVVRLNLKTIC